MSFQDDIREIASIAMEAISSITTTAYFFQTSSATYSPTTGLYSDSGKLTITGTDIAAVDTDNKITSTTTDLSSLPVNGQYIKISGFSNSENNGYKKPVTVTDANNVILSGTELVDEAAGNTITITGNFYILKGLKRSYKLDEIDGQRVIDGDAVFEYAGKDMSIIHKPNDILYIIEDGAETTWNIISIKTDSVKAIYGLQIRKP